MAPPDAHRRNHEEQSMSSRPRRRRKSAAAIPAAAPRRERSHPPLAVIDIGSNSGRVTVMRLHPSGHLEVLADARFPLRLAREVDAHGRLPRAAIERTIGALRDFRAIALGAGATSILVVATSAVREARNGALLVERVRRELGLKVVVIDGDREAAFAYLGAVHGLPVDHGLLLDLGGGSLEVSQFRDRKLIRTWTLPLGALRVSDRFLHHDPPSASELKQLKAYIEKTIRKSGIPQLGAGERLIGTGGTIRNIAKIEGRARHDALPSVHGYVLPLERVRQLAARASSLRLAARASIPGLNKDRADSIVGGFLCLQIAMQTLAASEIQVSGQGLREGIALATLGKSPPPAATVRQASVEALMRRFVTCKLDVARRRVRIARRLLDLLEPEAGDETRELLQHVCMLLDIGRSVDYFERHRNAGMIVAAADLQGFSQRGISLTLAALFAAGNAANRLRTVRASLRPKDHDTIQRVATLLLVADEIERRTLPGQPLLMQCKINREALVVQSEVLAGWQPRSIGERFRRTFGRELRITGA
jgi:exopolyphosphatase/guanosine-5'-triphosphate,3'-diphosphate pyrophosphatase